MYFLKAVSAVFSVQQLVIHPATQVKAQDSKLRTGHHQPHRKIGSENILRKHWGKKNNTY